MANSGMSFACSDLMNAGGTDELGLYRDRRDPRPAAFFRFLSFIKKKKNLNLLATSSLGTLKTI